MPNHAFGRKELWDLWVTVVLAFSLLGYHVANTCLAWLPPGFDRPVHHALCAWIFGVLWIAYRRWRQARLIVEDLETFLRSINTEAILVLDGRRRITLCNEAVLPIFGYTPEELLGQSTDLLYGDRRRNRDNPSEIRDTMDRRGFHIGTARGKRKNGDVFDVEISSSVPPSESRGRNPGHSRCHAEAPPGRSRAPGEDRRGVRACRQEQGPR